MFHDLGFIYHIKRQPSKLDDNLQLSYAPRKHDWPFHITKENTRGESQRPRHLIYIAYSLKQLHRVQIALVIYVGWLMTWPHDPCSECSRVAWRSWCWVIISWKIKLEICDLIVGPSNSTNISNRWSCLRIASSKTYITIANHEDCNDFKY